MLVGSGSRKRPGDGFGEILDPDGVFEWDEEHEKALPRWHRLQTHDDCIEAIARATYSFALGLIKRDVWEAAVKSATAASKIIQAKVGAVQGDASKILENLAKEPPHAARDRRVAGDQDGPTSTLDEVRAH
jgi:hypothetical protein